MKVSSPLAIIGLLAAAGCAGEVAPPRPFESATADVEGKRPRTAPTATSDEAPPADDASPSDGADPTDVDPPLPPGMPAPDTAWLGVLPATEWATFGGAPYCTYRARLTNVRVNVRLTATGRIVATFVTGTAEEQGLDGCEHQPIPPNLHKYTYSPDAPSEGPFTARNVAGNKPAAEMTGEVVITDPTTGRATLRWRRIDAKAPLDWTITAAVPLQRR